MAKTSASLDQTLVNTHGARAFKNYILTEKPGTNMPYVRTYMCVVCHSWVVYSTPVWYVIVTLSMVHEVS